MKEMTERAVRVLALAVSDTPVSAAGDFSRLILVGLVGIRDEIRPEARAAVKQVCDAGIQAVLITGDNKETAAAIARETGLIGKSGRHEVITSGELASMSDDEIKRRLFIVRARRCPPTKEAEGCRRIGLVTA